MNTEKQIHAPDYDGPDRRTYSRRPEDIIAANLKIVVAVVSIVIVIVTMATAWTTSQRVLDAKADREDMDKKLTAMSVRQDRFEEVILQDVLPQLKRMDARLTAIYCNGKPAGCQ